MAALLRSKSGLRLIAAEQPRKGSAGLRPLADFGSINSGDSEATLNQQAVSSQWSCKVLRIAGFELEASNAPLSLLPHVGKGSLVTQSTVPSRSPQRGCRC